MIEWFSQANHRLWIAAALFGVALVIGLIAFLRATRAAPSPAPRPTDPRDEAFNRWWAGSPADRQALITHRSDQPCPGAPFVLPAEGYIGLLYADPRGPYSEAHRHQGIDIFSPGDPGQTPVYAAYDGYLTREAGWKSALILRVPDDPLSPGRQIWLYYTHMADSTGLISTIDPAYPPDTHGVFVKQGTQLGTTGNFSGDALNPVGVHLHFSIVLDDGLGGYRNELEFNNTVDPSRYLGIPVNYGCAAVVPACRPDPLCKDAILSDGGG